MAIQARRGNEADYLPSRMVSAEFGVSVDVGKVHIAFAPGNSKTLMTEEDAKEQILEATKKATVEAQAWAHGNSYTKSNVLTETIAVPSATNTVTLSSVPDEVASVTVGGTKVYDYSISGATITLPFQTESNVEVKYVKYETVDNSKDNAKYYSEQASNSATAAATSENNASTSAQSAAVSAQAASNSQTAAKTSEVNAKTSEVKAKSSEDKAKVSEEAALNSENNAKTSEEASKTSETNALTSEVKAKSSEEAAKVSETNAKTSEDNSKANEYNSEAWAVGERNGVAVDSSDKTYQNNSKWYSEQSHNSELAAKTSADEAENALTEVKNYAGIVVPKLYFDEETGILYKSADAKKCEVYFDEDDGALYYKFSA